MIFNNPLLGFGRAKKGGKRAFIRQYKRIGVNIRFDEE